jgi:hypothetical protein
MSSWSICPLHGHRDLLALLESHLQLVADQFELVALILLVLHALVQFDAIGLHAMEFLAVMACILLCILEKAL